MAEEEQELGGGFIGSCCQNCGSLSYSSEWMEAFSVMLCNSCKREEPLISKGKAKSVYLLTDKDFKNLGYVTKVNPQNKNWSSMKLHLQSQVKEVAWQRWGGEEELELEKQRRADAVIEGRIKRRREDADGAEEEGRGDARHAAQLERLQREHAGPSVEQLAEVEAEEF